MVEEWFHLLDNDSTRSEAEWVRYPVRIYENMERIFRILEDTDTRATFFVIGWIARTYPDLVRRIAEKYEIGSHTMNHQLVWQQNRKAFKEDVSASVSLLEDITGKTGAVFPRTGLFRSAAAKPGLSRLSGSAGSRSIVRCFRRITRTAASLPTVRPCRVLSAMKV